MSDMTARIQNGGVKFKDQLFVSYLLFWNTSLFPSVSVDHPHYDKISEHFDAIKEECRQKMVKSGEKLAKTCTKLSQIPKELDTRKDLESKFERKQQKLNLYARAYKNI